MLVLTIRGEVEQISEEQAFEAMRRYYQAQTAGDETAKLVRVLEGPSEESSAQLGLPMDVSEATSLQIARQERSLRERGIALPPPVYAPSTQVVPVGDAGFRVLRRPWSDSAEVSEVLAVLRRLVRREERTEYTVKLGKISMQEEGKIQFGQGWMYCEERALKQLIRLAGVFPKGSAYLAEIEPGLRRHNWRKRAPLMTLDKQVKLRVRRNPLTGLFSVFAVVTPQYATMDIDELVGYVAPAFAASTLTTPARPLRGTVVYDSGTTDLRIEASEPWTGKTDAHEWRPGVQLRTNDRGDGGIHVFASARRETDSAQFLLGQGKDAVYYTQHQGDMSRVKDDLLEALPDAGVVFARFIVMLGDLEKVGPSTLFGSAGARSIFTEWGPALESGVRRGPLVDLLMANYANTPMRSVADLVHALAMCHGCPDIDQHHLEKIEAHAWRIARTLARRAQGEEAA
jgi:hypothetical protein